MAEKRRQGGSHSKPETKKEKRSPFLRKESGRESKAAPSEDVEELDTLPMEEESLRPELSEVPEPMETETEAKPSRAQARRMAKEAKKAEKAEKAAEQDNSPEGIERRRKSKIAIIVVCTVALIIAAAATFAGYSITVSNKNLPNLYFGDVAVGGLTREETQAALDAANWDREAKKRMAVELPTDVTVWLRRRDSGVVFSSKAAVDMADSYGHGANWFENLFEYISNIFKPVDLLETGRVVDTEYIRRRLQTGADQFKDATGESGYVIDEESSTLHMVKGGGQLELDMDAMCAAAERALISGEMKLEYDTYVSLPDMPDFNAIHKELERDPVDAYYTETFEVVQDVVGCRFDVAQAEKIWTEADYAQPIEIPLEINYPKVTGEALEAQLYRDVLGTQTTSYPLSSDNRINNLNQAVRKISGLILLPGETFSYNETVGQRTEEAGFLPAGAYENGEVVEQIGGGVCQVSSTLYSATLYAQMETVDRTCHIFAVDYLDKGMDATVSWPKPDFKFKNCREYPIKIIAYCDNEARTLTVNIMGTDTDGSYVKIRRDTYTVFGEYGEAIGVTIQQYRDIYAADGTFLRTEAYNYMDVYYLHGYQEITAKAKAASEAAAAGAEGGGSGGDGGGGDYSGAY